MTPKLEKALSKEAQLKHGTTPEQLALDRLSRQFFVSEEEDEKTVNEATGRLGITIFLQDALASIGRLYGSLLPELRRTVYRVSPWKSKKREIM